MKEQEQSMQQFKDIINQSVSDINSRDYMQLEEEEKLKIEKAKKLFQYDGGQANNHIN